MTDVMDLTPTVQYQPCHVFSEDADAGGGTCGACGWLEEDHWRAESYLAERQPVGTRG